MTYTDHDAFGHPSYDAGVSNAVRRAFNEAPAEFAVYYDGKAIYVRDTVAVPPPEAKRVCIAQKWDSKTVQIRFDGAKSEFRNA